MNLLEIAGFLGQDAEERFTSTGKRIIELRVATKTRKGSKDETLWWRVTIWDDRFDKMLPYLKKGTALIIVGEMLPPETYTAKDGTVKISLNMRAEIVRFSPFGKSEKEPSQSAPQKVSYEVEQSPEHGHGEDYMAHAGKSEGFTGDDLPF